MSKQTIVGGNPLTIWLLIILGLIAVGITSYFFAVVGPRQQLAAQSTATAQAALAETERFYAAGVALQQAGDWTAAAESYRQVVSRDAGYKDAAQRLAEVLGRMEGEKAAATAAVVAFAATTQAGEAATATHVAESTATAQAAAQATQTAAPSATAQALENLYQRAIGLIGLNRWTEAEELLNEIFDTDPGFKDVQIQLATVNAQLMPISTPTATWAPIPTFTTTPISTPSPTLKGERSQTDSNIITLIRTSTTKRKSLYTVGQEGNVIPLLMDMFDLQILAISPDRKYLAVVVRLNSGANRVRNDIVVISRDGKEKTTVIEGTPAEYNPNEEAWVFSSTAMYLYDGQLLIAERSGSNVIYYMAHLDGSELKIMYMSENVPTPTPN